MAFNWEVGAEPMLATPQGALCGQSGRAFPAALQSFVSADEKQELLSGIRRDGAIESPGVFDLLCYRPLIVLAGWLGCHPLCG